MDIDEAVKACRESQYTGWQMVTFVQKYVNKYMRFSLDNTSDAPRTAFSKGKGYSWQQAWCVHYILKKVNIRSELVYTTKADFYESRSKRQKIREGAHVWCRVRLNDTVKDVCSCNKECTGRRKFCPCGACTALQPDRTGRGIPRSRDIE